ncbi:UNVERIFIED_CONTAM: hypothetical protein Slati_3097100 [Sesamum latifolium]|uniref:DUF4283 domain-containing protein n=1 Tax=Sesamum latifolium TaxID=2727402 RepID=A0AAW2UVB5_9LAMI
MEEVIEGGPWLFQGQPIILQQWELGMALQKHKHTQVPVWIRLKHLPVEFWTNEGLSIVASGIGRPLYQDAIMKACTRLDFARVCVMLDISSKLPKHIVVMVPRDDGGEVPCRVDVEYEWLPPKSTSTAAGTAIPPTARLATSPAVGPCTGRFEHATPQQLAPTPVVSNSRSLLVVVNLSSGNGGGREGNKGKSVVLSSPLVVGGPSMMAGEPKGKDIVLYNAFDALILDDDIAESSSQGPNRCSPPAGDPC